MATSSTFDIQHDGGTATASPTTTGVSQPVAVAAGDPTVVGLLLGGM